MNGINDIDFASVEETRPPIYTAMKYWGKKPHNIWRKYVENYTPENGTFLDPFTGSGMSALEAFKAGRKATAFDLNPLSSFLIEVYASEFDHEEFLKTVDRIYDQVLADPTYRKIYSTQCNECKAIATIQHAKWERDLIYEMGSICENHKKPLRLLKKPSKDDLDLAKSQDETNIPYWYPKEEFPASLMISASVLRIIGGNRYSKLWTRRNLYTLSKIFDEISKITDTNLQKQLLFGFIQSVHLSSKMCIPREAAANRPFSTSWGRSTFLAGYKQMEMNPLMLFRGSCKGKQSVESALKSAKEYLGGTPKLLYVDRSNKSNRSSTYDIKYGIVDINTLDDYIDDESIDFVLTDPPYGGLVQYLDLSTIWLVWLHHIDERMKPNFDAEITIKNGQQDLELYKLKFTNGLKKIHKTLKNDGKLVITFHNKELKIWNSFLNSIMLAGFTIEKVIHQQNRRTGESNVGNPYGTSASDFYIRCVKSPSASANTNSEEFEHFVVTTAIRIIAERNEPTPYQILFNGLLAEISKAGFDIEDFDNHIEGVLSKHLGDIFSLTENKEIGAGNFWWFEEPSKHIKFPDRSLADRVEDTVLRLLRRNITVSIDEVLAEIYTKYPNGLTPTTKTVTQTLSKYATRSHDKWMYKAKEIEPMFTKHSEAIYDVTTIGKKLGYEVYIGKREQPEPYESVQLGSFATLRDLSCLEVDSNVRKRAEMIDVVWVKNNEVVCAIEVENSTNFTSGIQRASNLSAEVPKLMVLPDYRVDEIKRIRDNLFVDNFDKYNWSYLTYSDIKKLTSSRTLSWHDIKLYEKKLSNG